MVKKLFTMPLNTETQIIVIATLFFPFMFFFKLRHFKINLMANLNKFIEEFKNEGLRWKK
jgi:hypothetical protein